VKLRWTITYSPENELIDGFFIGYRSFENTLSPPQTSMTSQTSADSKLSHGSVLQTAQSDIERPTFTYKTIRLATTANTDSTMGLQVSESGSQVNSVGPSVLSPTSTSTKQVPSSMVANSGSKHGIPSTMIQSQFEYVINGLDRNTEYTILIQCFNRKGAGPTSDPMVFRTFASGKFEEAG